MSKEKRIQIIVIGIFCLSIIIPVAIAYFTETNVKHQPRENISIKK